MKNYISNTISFFVFLQQNKNCNRKQYSFFAAFVFILLFSNAVQAQYCIPSSGGGSCITNVTVGTINNTTTGCPSSANNYNTFASPFVFYIGGSNTLSISCNSLANTGAWIDFDHNMVLDPSEYFPVFSNALNGTINITAPGGAMTGATLLRIRSIDTSTAILSTDACNTFLSGETEDYTISIAALSSCTGTPNAGITVATSDTICGGMMDTLSLVGATVAPGLSYSWQRAACVSCPWVALLNAFGSSYVCIPPMGGTWCYHCIVTCLNTGAYDTSVAICITSLTAPTSITNVAICSNQLPYIWNGQSYTTAGTYTANFPNPNGNGCDSIAYLILSNYPIPTHTGSLSVCQSQLPYLWNGQLLTTAGTYTDTLLNASMYGCDSISILNFGINPMPDTTTTLSGTTITSNQVSAPSTYQWIDCSNNQPIISATANSYTATTNGSYAVVVSNVFCTDTSACVTVTTVGVDNLKSISNIHVFPNPTSSILYIGVNSATSQNITFKLLDMSGRIANQKTVKVNSGLQHFNMNMAELPKGIYTLEVYEDGQRVYVQKVESKK